MDTDDREFNEHLTMESSGSSTYITEQGGYKDLESARGSGAQGQPVRSQIISLSMECGPMEDENNEVLMTENGDTIKQDKKNKAPNKFSCKAWIR